MLNEAKEAWNGLGEFRRKRERCRNYTFGRQWNDYIEVDGRRMTEYEYILREGNIPLKNNLIRRIVRNVMGVFRKQLPELTAPYYAEELSETAAENSLEEIFSRSMEEFLISGMAVVRKSFGFRNGKCGVWTDMVSPESFFFNSSAHDVRGWDVSVVGQFHDVDFRQWCESFVRDAAGYSQAEKQFAHGRRKVKITEVWRREYLSRWLIHDKTTGKARRISTENNKPPALRKGERCVWIADDVWRYYFLNEDGKIISSGDSPYLHRSHPYVFKCYPFLEGEIQSFVGDMIDQQRYTNRLITLYDWVVRASAKGVLLVPKQTVEPEDIQDVADQWGRFNGVIVYDGEKGLQPHQVNSSSANMGISELLEIQLKMLEDVSGVNGALQGNLSANSVSGTLFNQQTENSMNSLTDLLKTFGIFIEENYRKDKALHMQMEGGMREVKFRREAL